MLRDEIVKMALEEVGYTENPPNSNMTKYGEWFGLNGVKWCAIFVCWVYTKAGVLVPRIGFDKGFASCEMAVQHFRKLKRTKKVPTKGALVFFDWDKNGKFDHVGIVTEVLNFGKIKTVEGNTSFKNDRNGGSVMERVRDTKAVNMLFADMLYPF